MFLHKHWLHQKQELLNKTIVAVSSMPVVPPQKYNVVIKDIQSSPEDEIDVDSREILNVNVSSPEETDVNVDPSKKTRKKWSRGR